jgi:hypothetical protein
MVLYVCREALRRPSNRELRQVAGGTGASESQGLDEDEV